MSVRPAVASDADDLAAIHIGTWQVAYVDIFPDEFLKGLDLEARVKWFERSIRNRADILVSEDDSGVTGFCFVGMSSSDPGWGELYAIYVHPDVWGRGHGYELLAAAEERLVALGFSRVLLWVLEPNSQARHFYERQDWQLAKPIKLEEIGGTPVTEVRYEKDLRDAS